MKKQPARKEASKLPHYDEHTFPSLIKTMTSKKISFYCTYWQHWVGALGEHWSWARLMLKKKKWINCAVVGFSWKSFYDQPTCGALLPREQSEEIILRLIEIIAKFIQGYGEQNTKRACTMRWRLSFQAIAELLSNQGIFIDGVQFF